MQLFGTMKLMVLALIILVVLVLIYHSIKKIFLYQKIYNIEYKIDKKTGKAKKGMLDEIKELSNQVFLYRKNKKAAQTLYYFMILFPFVIFITLVVLGEFLPAIFIPVIFFLSSKKILKLMAIPKDVVVREELPQLIRHFIKVLSQTDDIATVLYESSKFSKEPLRSAFQEASRRISNESFEVVLDDLGKKIDNMWVYSFVFILSSLKSTSKKQDVVNNLVLLAEIVEKEDRQATKAVVEKKGMIFLNWVLLVIGIAGFLFHVIFTEKGYEFFFSTNVGNVLVIVGFVLSIGTILINLKLEQKN